MTAVVKWTFEDYWQGQGKTATFYYTGAPEQFVVPETTTVIKATLHGGSGGGEYIDNVWQGGRLVCVFPVTPGETLNIRVGGDGSRTINSQNGDVGGYNGGGNAGNSIEGMPHHSAGYPGGGASDIRRGGDDLAHRIAVAAGAGGNSGEAYSHLGGHANGGAGRGPVEGNDLFYYGGKGATATAPGSGGVNNAVPNGNGSLGQGGHGRGSLENGAGGGGGGWFGGGGGGSTLTSGVVLGQSGGGGGGSNGVGDGVQIIASGYGLTTVSPDYAYVSLEYLETADQYVFEINPNDGGAATISKSIAMTQTVGPNRVNILQEGQSQAPLLDFSGIILTQQQLEAMEYWFDRRVLVKIVDDLGREYYGVFSKFAPKRVRRASNFWYHTYDAEFTLSAYKNASGNWLYGRMPNVNSAQVSGDEGA